MMQVAAWYHIDKNHECHTRIAAKAAEIETALASTQTGTKHCRLRERHQEAEARLKAAQEIHEAAKVRHFSALSGDDDTELEAARKEALSTCLELDILQTEVSTIHKLLVEAIQAVEAERKRIAPEMWRDAKEAANARVLDIVEKLWSQINTPEIFSQLETLILEMGIQHMADKKARNRI